MHQQVRLLAIDDAPAVAQLEREARALLQHQRGGPDLLAERSAVGDWTDHVGNIDLPTWVGTIDGSVLAYLELCVMAGAADSTPATRAVVMQVYVEPLAREVGFGDWLLEAAIDYARERGCAAIEGYALPGDRATKNLYERAGITARKITVAKSL